VVFAAIAADFDFVPQFVTGISFHRGISHSFGAAFLCSVILVVLLGKQCRRKFQSVMLLVFISYSLHLLLDLVTSGGRGIPLLWPLTPSLIQLPFALFPQVHHSEGLFYSGHVYFVLFEGAYSLLILWMTYVSRNHQLKHTSLKEQVDARLQRKVIQKHKRIP
jgi:inner membrane protein